VTANRLSPTCATPSDIKPGRRAPAATAMPAQDGQTDLSDRSTRTRFESLALPHLDAAFNLARWLVRNDDDASDIVQDAFVRAMRSFGGFRGDQARPWLLAIVRNTAYSWLGRNRDPRHVSYEPDLHDDADHPDASGPPSPETELSRAQDRRAINDALARLPVEMREALVLRELEELPYRQIAAIQAIPIGTVMSRLSRGRNLLGRYLRQGMPGVDDELP
jgi:RNA polymerase sigma-70 factor, ECF subfamily